MAETHVISALKSKRSELAGHMLDLSQQLDKARADLVYVEGALRVFGFDGDVVEIKPTKKRSVANLFKRNEVARYIFDQLRMEPDGLLTTEIADRLIIAKGWDMRDKDLVQRVRHRVGQVINTIAKRNQVEPLEMFGNNRKWRMPRPNGSNSPSIDVILDEPSPT